MALEVTDKALRQISKYGKCLRITVKAGGCAGVKCLFDFEEVPKPQDHVFSYNQKGELLDPSLAPQPSAATLITDPLSFSFIDGACVDYCEEMLSSHFLLKNPKATASCGCGDSFSIF